MGFFNKAKQYFGSGQRLAKDHGDQINKAVDGAQSKFTHDKPGLNRKIDGAQQKLSDYSRKK